MSSNVLEDLSLGDASSSGSAMLELEPWSPKIAGGEKADKEEGASVIPAKATVGENPIIDIRASIQKRVVLNKPKVDLNRAPPGTAKRRMAEPDIKPKKTRKSKNNPEDRLQLKNPPEGEMLVPMELCLDNPVGIPPSTETEHKNCSCSTVST